MVGKQTSQIVKNNSVLFIIIVILEISYFSWYNVQIINKYDKISKQKFSY